MERHSRWQRYIDSAVSRTPGTVGHTGRRAAPAEAAARRRPAAAAGYGFVTGLRHSHSCSGPPRPERKSSAGWMCAWSPRHCWCGLRPRRGTTCIPHRWRRSAWPWWRPPRDCCCSGHRPAARAAAAGQPGGRARAGDGAAVADGASGGSPAVPGAASRRPWPWRCSSARRRAATPRSTPPAGTTVPWPIRRCAGRRRRGSGDNGCAPAAQDGGAFRARGPLGSAGGPDRNAR